MPTHYDKRNNRWRYTFNQVVNGQRVRVSKLLPKAWTREEAKAFDQTESARLYGIAVGSIKARILIQSAVELYVTHRCPDLKTGRATAQELNLIEPYFRDRFLDELAEVGIEYTAAAREAGLAPASIKNRLSYLRAACRYAQRNHGLGDRNARHEVAMPVVRNERQVYATRAEMLSIARKCGASEAEREARALIRLAFYAGVRLGEFMDMAAKNKLLPDGFLLKDTKNNSDRIAPMHPRLRVLAKYLPFRYSRVWLQRLVRRAMDGAGFKHMHLHDLRHSTASALINNGVDLYVVGAVLGHKDARSTKRYAHLNPTTLNAAVLKIK
jgi:site-specific recombinase XerD